MKTQQITPLYPFQERCEDRIEELDGRLLVSMSMGLGKTLCALTHLHRHPEIQRCLVVCPASLKWNWQYEASHHLGMRSEVLSTRKPPRRSSFLKTSRLLIINYDILAWWLRWLVGAGEEESGGVDKGYDPQMVIWDESHLLTGMDTLRTRASRILARGDRKLLFLSGTPLINRPSELWTCLNLLRPDLYPTFTPFALRYCQPRLTRAGRWTFTGASNLEELHSELGRVSFRLLKEDVLEDLPPKRVHLVPVPLEDDSDYLEARNDFRKWLRKKEPKAGRTSSQAEGLAQLGYLKRLAAEKKLPAVLEWIRDFMKGTDEKLLAFGIHRKVLDRIQEEFPKISVRVDGQVIGERRQQLFNTFNANQKVRLLIGNIDAAGMGWSCRATSNVLFFELPWSPGKLAQAIDRCHGVGRGVAGQKVQAWCLVARGTIEEILCHLLQKKQKILDAVLDGGPRGDDFNLFDKLIEAVQNEDLEE